MNTYAAYHVMHGGVDPSGLRQYHRHIHQQGVDELANTLEKQLSKAKQQLENAKHHVSKMSNARFDELVQSEKFRVKHWESNGGTPSEEAFTGTRDEFIGLIENELKSFINVVNKPTAVHERLENYTDPFFDTIVDESASHTFGNITLNSQFLFTVHGDINAAGDHVVSTPGGTHQSTVLEYEMQDIADHTELPICLGSCKFRDGVNLDYADLKGGARIRWKDAAVCGVHVTQVRTLVFRYGLVQKYNELGHWSGTDYEQIYADEYIPE